MGWTWATFNPTDPLDANEDPDQMEIGIVAVLPRVHSLHQFRRNFIKNFNWIHLIQSDYLAKHGSLLIQNGGIGIHLRRRGYRGWTNYGMNGEEHR